ncbi:MAG TPA: SUMF1/EgtB/PvdO family nonheme iron enzyme [Opitutaceae bacterium]|nr:SUMF1/EgtB/PvdO family nonheme iron enzyme [Opitutaceae bacterium]
MRAHTRPVRKSSRPSLLPWFGVGGAVLAVVGGVFVWGFLRHEDAGALASENDPAMRRLREESLEIEREFSRIRDLGIPTETDLQRLLRAIEAQREWMHATGNMDEAQNQRVRDLEAMHEAAWTRAAVARSGADEADGRALLKEGKLADGVAKLREALERQRLLNQRQGPGSGRNLARETELTQEIARLDAAPISEELANSTAEARKFRDAEKTAEALAAYHRAHELQLRLNREFGRTKFASLANLEELEVEIATLDSLAPLAESRDCAVKAAEARGRGAAQEAAALFERARDAQQKLNTDFPRSRHASAERVDELEVERQTELTVEAAERIVQLDRSIAAKLRARDVANVPEMILEGARLNDAMFTQLPRSRKLDPELRQKFNYLTLQRGVIEPLLRVMTDKFRNVPGRRGVQMLVTEVPQRVYEVVVRNNPSRLAGADLPVESVNLDDAQEFCRRLGWLLGRKVRLPTEEEYQAAVGVVPTGLEFYAHVWSQERSDQTTHQIASASANTAGLYDLLGNVAEWLAPDRPDAETSLVAGGSYADTAAQIAKIPLESRNRLERARTIGFRIVVE